MEGLFTRGDEHWYQLFVLRVCLLLGVYCSQTKKWGDISYLDQSFVGKRRIHVIKVSMDVLFTRKEVRKYHLFGSRVLQGRGGEDITVNNKYLLPLMKRCRGKTTSACVISEFIFIHLQRFLILKNSNFYLFI